MKRAALLLISAILLLMMKGTPDFPQMQIGGKIYPFPHIDALNVDNTYPGEISLELKDAKDYDKFVRELELSGWRKISEWDNSWEDYSGFADYFGAFFIKGDMGLSADYSFVGGYSPSIQINLINDRICMSAEEEWKKSEAKMLIEAHTGKKLIAIFTNDPHGAFGQMDITSYSVVWDNHYEAYYPWHFLIYENQLFEMEQSDIGSDHAVFDVDRDGEPELLAIVDAGRYAGVFKDNGIQFYAYKLADDPENPGKKTLKRAYYSHWDHPRMNDGSGYWWFYGFDTSDPDGVRLYEGRYVAGELAKTKDLGKIRLDGERLETEFFH
ncbi:MAG TPA: hypothetical protein DEQ02_06530 [Ruminococcaceae bacterium]|nr:hypothetical protein [Oscillospiraceae bacterium]